MWRLLYSKYKLNRKEKADLLKTIEVVSFACGTQIQDLNLPGCLNEIYKRQISCMEPIERLYYSAK